MPAARNVLRSVVVATAVATATLLPGAVAAADDTTTVTGELVQAWAEAGPDHAAAGHSAEGPVSWVQPAEGDAVPVDADGVAGLPSGSTVSVTVDGDTVVDSTLLESAPAAPALSDPAGLTNQVTVALVRPGGVPADDVTQSQVVDAVTGPVADFWAEQTGGAVRVGVTASSDWTATAADCSDATRLWNEVAAEVGFVKGPHKHLLLYVSGAARGCSYALAEVGAKPASGGRLYVTDVRPSAIAHELGHNFGLGHSSALQCDAAVESGTCRTAGYRDYYDVMGASWSELGSLNAPQAALLGVLPAGQQQSLSVLDGTTTVTLAPLSGTTGTRALRLTDAAGGVYWLEYRTAALRDQWLASDNPYRLQEGVLLRRAGAMPDTSVLLDGTPGPLAGWSLDFQSALPAGSAVTVAGGSFTIAVDRVSAAGAVLTITPTAPADGQVVPVPESQAAAPGTVMAGAGAGPAPALEAPEAPAVAPQAAELAALAVPATGHTPTPELESAADSTPISGFLIAAAGSVLGGVALLLVRRLRVRAVRVG